jgi:hypothetical protein
MRIPLNLSFKNPIHESLQELSASFLIIFSFIPWVHFGLNSRDSQPWGLLFALIFLITLYKKNFYKSELFIFALPIISLITWLFFSNQVIDFIALRAVISYATFAICIIAFLAYLEKYPFPWNLVITINILYLFIGVLQMYDINITEGIVQSRGLSKGGRGATSLTPEPTFFGIFLFFISFIYLAQCNFKPGRILGMLIFINLISIILLAKSSMALLYIIISAPFFIITRITPKTFVSMILISIIIIPLLIVLLEDSRIALLWSLLSDEGLYLFIHYDESVNDRVANLIYPIHGFIISDFMPSGFHSFTDMHNYLNNFYNSFFYYGNGGTSIMSFIGAYIYELGFFGFLFLLWLFLYMQNMTIQRVLDTSVLYIILLSAVPPSFPLVSFLIAVYLNKNKNIKLNEF